jgi:hypothetical protein
MLAVSVAFCRIFFLAFIRSNPHRARHDEQASVTGS